MVDAREQIKNALTEIESSTPFKVSFNFPQKETDGVYITYFEINNTSTSISVVDDIAFQIDVWAYYLETLIGLFTKADEKLREIGFKRIFVSPDFTPNETGSKYFRKTLRYGRKVDTRTNRLID